MSQSKIVFDVTALTVLLQVPKGPLTSVPSPQARRGGEFEDPFRSLRPLGIRIPNAKPLCPDRTVTNPPSIVCCIEKRRRQRLTPKRKRRSWAKITATFWSAAVSCRFEGAPERTFPQTK